MTIIEALRISRESGGKLTFMRVRGCGGFCRWVDGFTYHLDGEDLIADDWENVETGIPKLTGGRIVPCGPVGGR